jgi:hypothetical protein
LFYRCHEIGKKYPEGEEIIEACALIQNASCFETVARAILVLTL